MTAEAVAGQFATSGQIAAVRPYGGGHVNDSYLVSTGTGARYVLQRLNQAAFRRPDQVMENIVAVTQHLVAKANGTRQHLTLVRTNQGNWWHTEHDGEVWRLFEFVPGALEQPGPADMFQVGQAFGQFLIDLDDLPITSLHTTIADFHNELRYLAKLRATIAADPLGRVAQVGPEIQDALGYEAISHGFDDPDLMPLRVTHNDAKVSNILFDANSGQPLCVIDLDTVQPGWAVNDFGDAIRSGASTAPEDEPDTTKVAFSLELFQAFTRGYLGACGAVLAPSEIVHLRHGAALMTLETSLRFLTDYIEGDIYYRTTRAGQNLDRARNQLTLLADIEANWQSMGTVIDAAMANQTAPR